MTPMELLIICNAIGKDTLRPVQIMRDVDTSGIEPIFEKEHVRKEIS